MDLANIIVLLVVVVVLLVIYRLLISTETFGQLEICDYNSPDPNQFCQSIQKGCTDLIHNNIDLNNNIKDTCEKLPTDTKDMIDVAINCNDTVNKIIMNNYVKNEVCSQIKNFPEIVPSEETFPPSTYKPLDKLSYLKETTTYFVDNQNGYAPF
jgi:hypothetical protein